MRRALLAEQPLLSTAGVAAVLMPVFAFGLGWPGIAMALFVAATALAVGVHLGGLTAGASGSSLRYALGETLSVAGPGFEEAQAWSDARGWYPVEGGSVVAFRDGSVRALPHDDAAVTDALRTTLGDAVSSRARRELLPALGALALGAALASAVTLFF